MQMYLCIHVWREKAEQEKTKIMNKTGLDKQQNVKYLLPASKRLFTATESEVIRSWKLSIHTCKLRYTNGDPQTCCHIVLFSHRFIIPLHPSVSQNMSLRTVTNRILIGFMKQINIFLNLLLFHYWNPTMCTVSVYVTNLIDFLSMLFISLTNLFWFLRCSSCLLFLSVSCVFSAVSTDLCLVYFAFWLAILVSISPLSP